MNISLKSICQNLVCSTFPAECDRFECESQLGLGLLCTSHADQHIVSLCRNCMDYLE